MSHLLVSGSKSNFPIKKIMLQFHSIKLSWLLVIFWFILEMIEISWSSLYSLHGSLLIAMTAAKKTLAAFLMTRGFSNGQRPRWGDADWWQRKKILLLQKKVSGIFFQQRLNYFCSVMWDGIELFEVFWNFLIFFEPLRIQWIFSS